MTRIRLRPVVLAMMLLAAACSKKPPVAAPPAGPQLFPGTPTAGAPTRPPTPPAPSGSVASIPTDPAVTSSGSGVDPYAGKDADDINRDSPLKPVYFLYDSDELDDTARQTLSDDAEVLKRYASWVITVEGHCDERGTAEYNLALGDRRALAARSYLVSLGIPAERLRTVSYGKEFPFDAAHSEAAWLKNRRAHFTVTATSPSRRP
jgi:peptidoglycan-associated lipoprotein